jgi:hypothetical protein
MSALFNKVADFETTCLTKWLEAAPRMSHSRNVVKAKATLYLCPPIVSSDSFRLENKKGRKTLELGTTLAQLVRVFNSWPDAVGLGFWQANCRPPVLRRVA